MLHTPAEILMVMEYVAGGDLLEVLNTRQRFSEAEVRHIFCQICCGVSFCHSLGVAHRDLKPENILISKKRDSPNFIIKVADFGLSTLMQTGEMLSTACGSPHYVAPEILNFSGDARYDGRESDVWSLGVILHVMLCYKLPFEAESTQLLYKKIRLGLPALPLHLSAQASELLRSMLEVVPERRVLLAQVVTHPWLQLQGCVPQLTQTVDAVLDQTTRTLDGSEMLSATNLFALGPELGRLGPGGGGGGGGGGVPQQVRRASTFDALPRSYSSDSGDEFSGPPAARSRAARRTQARMRAQEVRSPPVTRQSSPLAGVPESELAPARAASSPTHRAPQMTLGVKLDAPAGGGGGGGAPPPPVPPIVPRPAEPEPELVLVGNSSNPCISPRDEVAPMASPRDLVAPREESFVVPKPLEEDEEGGEGEED